MKRLFGHLPKIVQKIVQKGFLAHGLPWTGFLVRGPSQRHCVPVWYVIAAVTWFPQMIQRTWWFAWKNSLCSYNECMVYFSVIICLCLSLLIIKALESDLSVFILCLHEWPDFFIFSYLCVSVQASCLCSSAPCLLSSCCPAAYNSTVSRLAFSFFLLLGTMVSVIMILPGMENQLKKVSF